MRWQLLAFSVLLSTAASADFGGDNTVAPPKFGVELQKSVMVKMRDGVQLSTDLYFPVDAGVRLPTILVRTPYNKNVWRLKGANPASPDFGLWPSWHFASQGYVVAVQDTRGQYESEGEYIYAGGDARDGYDMTSWIARQPWSNGKVGTYGCSYLGEVQYQQATQRNPNLAAMIPQGAGPMEFRAGGGINGGAIELSSLVGWFRGNGSKLYLRPPPGTPRELVVQTSDWFRPGPQLPDVDYRQIWASLPVIDMLKNVAPPTDFEDVVSRDFSDPWWDKTDFVKPTDRFDVPALHVNSWYDYGVGETLKLFNQMSTNATTAKGRDHQFAIISPTTHCRSEQTVDRTLVGRRDVGDARLEYHDIYLRWFDYWLKGLDNGATSMPKLQLYVMGRNVWRGENEWPLARTQFTKYYLHSDGHANGRFGDGQLSTVSPSDQPPDSYVYDPATPVPTTGGALCPGCAQSSEVVAGALDQSDVEMRQDVLVYTTPALEQGVEVTGPIELVLYVSSTAKDTDFTAKLVDVYPDGTAYNVQEGILRARYREGFKKKVWMNPGEAYEIRVSLHATSNYFPPKHRIRLEVSSSSFPRFDRNLNTGGNNYDETDWVIATNSVHHSAKYPSHLVLPIIP
jgi:uncharacterized protein